MKLAKLSAVLMILALSFCLIGCKDFTVKIENSAIKVEFAKDPPIVQRSGTASESSALNANLAPDLTASVTLEWKKFYKDNFGLEVNFDGIKVPNPSPGHWDIFIPKDLDENTTIKACRKFFKVWVWNEDITSQISFNKRSNKDFSYFVRFKKNIEADEEYKNLSANDLVVKGVDGITLLERIILELYYFGKTGSHLDIKNWTLCSGSRYSDGRVPYACWRQRCAKFRVYWCSSDVSYSNLRAREAVSY